MDEASRKPCIKCGKSSRYSGAFSEWVCYSCGYREKGYGRGDVRLINANSWWTYLSEEKKIKIYQKNTKNGR